MADGWDLLFDALLEDKDEVVRRVRPAIQVEVPAFRGLPEQSLDDELRMGAERVLRAARDSRTVVNEVELAELAAVGEVRAGQGVPITDWLRAWGIGVEVVVGYAQEVGQREGIDDTQVLEVVQGVLAWADAAMLTSTDAHCKAECELAQAERGQRAAFACAVLFGELPVEELRIRAESFGLDPAGEYVAVRAHAVEGGSVVRLERALGFDGSAQRGGGVCALIDGDVAGFLPGPPARDVDGVVGFGPPRRLDQLPESYRLAMRAMMTARACGFSGAFDIASLGVRAAVVMDTDVGEALGRRYLEPLGTGGSAGEIAATVRAYLSCGMHVERTASALFVHQNTVRYRLSRFEELTGASLRDPEVMFEVWWALKRSMMGL